MTDLKSKFGSVCFIHAFQRGAIPTCNGPLEEIAYHKMYKQTGVRVESATKIQCVNVDIEIFKRSLKEANFLLYLHHEWPYEIPCRLGHWSHPNGMSSK